MTQMIAQKELPPPFSVALSGELRKFQGTLLSFS